MTSLTFVVKTFLFFILYSRASVVDGVTDNDLWKLIYSSDQDVHVNYNYPKDSLDPAILEQLFTERKFDEIMSTISSIGEKDECFPEFQHKLESNDIKLLNSGSSGKIYKFGDIAIKIVSENKIGLNEFLSQFASHEKNLKYYLREINTGRIILRSYTQEGNKLSNLNLILNSCIEKTIEHKHRSLPTVSYKFFILMPYFPASLADVISKETETQFDTLAYSNEWRLKLIDGIFLGVYFIHANNYVHRDIKPENIMLSEHGYPMISDFGFSKEFTNDERSMVGSPKYMAPEIIAGKTNYDGKVDVYSLGIMLFELFNMKSPIEIKSMTKDEILNYCNSTSYPDFSVELMELSVYCKNFSVLVSEMIKTDPDQRISFIRVFREWISYRNSVLEESQTLEQQIYNKGMEIESNSAHLQNNNPTEAMDVDYESINDTQKNSNQISNNFQYQYHHEYQYQHQPQQQFNPQPPQVMTTSTFFYATGNDAYFNNNFHQMFLMLQNKFMNLHHQHINQIHMII